MTLADLNIDDSGCIQKIHSKEDLRRRLFDLGFFPDVTVECVLKSPFGSPILYKVNGAFIALRKEDAGEIEVRYEN